MEDIREMVSEFKYEWKHNRREFVESLLGALSIVLAIYVVLVAGSAGGAK
jgi:hypothetical protein